MMSLCAHLENYDIHNSFASSKELRSNWQKEPLKARVHLVLSNLRKSKNIKAIEEFFSIILSSFRIKNKTGRILEQVCRTGKHKKVKQTYSFGGFFAPTSLEEGPFVFSPTSDCSRCLFLSGAQSGNCISLPSDLCCISAKNF